MKFKIYLLISLLLIELMGCVPEKQLFFVNPVAAAMEKQSQDGSDKQAEDVDHIENIQQWNHPVKEVFTKNKLVINKVWLLNNKTYPIFYLNFNSKITAASEKMIRQLLQEIAAKNGYWDFAIVDETQQIKIEVGCLRKQKHLVYIQINDNFDFFAQNQKNSSTSFDNLLKRRQGKELPCIVFLKRDLNHDGQEEMLVESSEGTYGQLLYLVTVQKGSYVILGKLPDVIEGADHRVFSCEMRQLDHSGVWYLVTKLGHLEGGSGFSIFKLDGVKFREVHTDFPGATGRGICELKDVDQDGIFEDVYSNVYDDFQMHQIFYYQRFDGNGPGKEAIGYANEKGRFNYPARPEDVIRCLIEGKRWQKLLHKELGSYVTSPELLQFEFDKVVDYTQMEYGGIDLEFSTLVNTNTRKVFQVVSDDTEGANKTIFCELSCMENRWKISRISMNKIL